jgi:two-component system CAI-1 autoinducer sensor kinase/phosphatase CqsS
VERYGDFQVRGNERLLVNVLLNLLRNSLQAIGETGKGEVYVFVAPGEAADYIIVTDTGPGIPEDVLPQVFNEFFTTRPVGSGTGMGLAFCRRVMDGVGGRIDCHSRLGEFTEMVLSFPRLRRQSTRPPQDPREPRPTEAPE